MGVTANLDHDPSSTTSSSSFHGTAIIVFQTMSQNAISRNWSLFPPTKKNNKLPSSYSILPEFSLRTSTIECNEIFQDEGNFTSLVEVAEDKWLSHASKLLNNDLRRDDRLSWAGKF